MNTDEHGKMKEEREIVIRSVATSPSLIRTAEKIMAKMQDEQTTRAVRREAS